MVPYSAMEKVVPASYLVGCKLNAEIPIYQLGQLRLMWRGICGEKCVLSPYSYQSTLVMLLLTLLGRRLQSESCLLAAILW